MSRDDAAIEKQIVEKGLTAPRVTNADIDALTSNSTIRYHVFFGVLTLCVMQLPNGFIVTGESACASPENFDEELGRKIAFGQARGKIWPFAGYALREKLHNGG